MGADRIVEVRLRRAECPGCRRPADERALEGGDVVCPGCATRWGLELEAVGADGAPQVAAPWLAREALYAALAARGAGGERELAERDPALLLNCIAHHGGYEAARRAVRRWLRSRGEAPAGGAAATRCPYCRDAFEEDEAAFACGCGARLHADCRLEAGRCTTLGCAAPFEPPLAGRAPGVEARGASLLARAWRLLRRPHVLRGRTPRPPSVRLFGLPFLLAGVFLVGVVGLPELWRGGSDAVVLPLGLPFLAVGVAMCLLARWARVDRRAGTVRWGWGLDVPLLPLVPLLWRTARVEGLVTLGREEWHRGKQSGVTVFPVRLRCRGAGGVLQEALIAAPRSYLAGRRLAERVAKHVGAGLQDGCGAATFRPAGTLDQRWRDRRAHVPPAPAPAAPRTTASLSEERAEFVRPASWGCAAPLAAGVGLAAAAGALVATGASAWGAAPALGLALLTGVALERCGEDRLVATSAGLERVRRWGPLRRRTTLPTDALEELDVAPSRGSWGRAPRLCAHGDDGALEFGDDLPADELAWILAQVAARLRGPTK